MRIGLVGYFNHGNYGDDIFLEVLTEALSSVGEVVCLGRQAERDSSIDAIVIGGGDLIYQHTWSFDYFRPWMHSNPVYVIGVGVSQHHRMVEPDVVERLKVWFRQPNVRHLSFRDYESARWVFSRMWPMVPVQVAPDLSWAWFNPYPEPPTRKRALVVSSYGNVVREIRKAALEDIDLVHAATGETLRGERVPDGYVVRSASEPRQIEQIIADYEIVYSMKFHGMLSALAAGRKSMDAICSDKAANFMRAIGHPELGLQSQQMKAQRPMELTVAARSYLREGARRSIDELVTVIRKDAG